MKILQNHSTELSHNLKLDMILHEFNRKMAPIGLAGVFVCVCVLSPK